MTDWLFPSVIATLIGTAVLASIYYFLYRSDRQSYLAIWTWGWGAYAMRFVFMLLYLSAAFAPYRPALLVANQLAALGSGLLLLWGSYDFLDRKMPRAWLFVGCAAAVYIVATALVGSSLFWLSLPTFLFLGGVYVWTGITFLRHRKLRENAAKIVGVSFILWGVHKADYPFVRPFAWAAPWGYLLAAVLEIVIAFGMLMIYFQRSQERVKESEKRYRTILENAPILFMVHRQGNIEYINRAGARILGGEDTRDFRHRSAFEFVQPEFAALVRERTERAEKGRSNSIEDIGVFRLDGGKVVLQATSLPIDFENRPAVLVMGTDVTERKQAENALASAHERFLTVLDGIDATIYVADMETYEILFMNRHMIESFGRDMTGEKCWKAFREEPGPCSECTNDQLLDENGNPAGVCTWQGRNPVTGKHYINYDRAIEWTDERIVRLQIATDITELKRLENRLRQAQKMEAIGTLAGGIAHDFNNILASAIGYTELAIDDVEKGSAAEKNLQEVYAAWKRARDLVKQILAFARQSDEDTGPVQVSLVAKEVFKFLRSTIPSTIELRQQIKSRSMIMGSATQLHQILMNLCTNAAQAMEKGGGTLAISVRDVTAGPADREALSALDPGDYVEVRVSDTGPGMAPEIAEKIFEPYFTTKGPGEGTGMGLAVVHGIVESYGGNIAVESLPGKGTSFTLHLPAAKMKKDRRSAESGELPSGTERVLFVDDEAPIADIGSRILQRLGYAVTVRTGSLEALALFKSRPEDFDLVITDLTMPNMTGDDLAAEMIRIRPDIPVVLCTGYSRKVSEEAAADIGIRAFVYKPVVKADLAGTVRDVLDDDAARKLSGRILVIDDEPGVREMFKRKLAGTGCRIIEAENGNEGLARYREKKPDLVITDLVMPEKEGLETITALKREDPQVKIIAISGGGRNSAESYLEIARKLGVSETFSKPFDWRQMIGAIRTMLEQR